MNGVSRALDRDVHQIVQKFEDQLVRENQGSGKDSPPKFTVAGVYDSIKRSNSSLARQKKRLLEDSIERVLRQRKKERQDDDEEAHLEAKSNSPESKGSDYSLANRRIVKSWSMASRQRNMSQEATASLGDSLNATLTTSTQRQSDDEPRPKKRKTERKGDYSPPSDLCFENLGGMNEAIKLLVDTVTFPMCWPELCLRGVLQPARGILLHGPPGCGKTLLANTFASELKVSFMPVSAPTLVAGMSGESEKKIRELYETAKKIAPCLIFIDEIDAIMGKRENAQREMEKRMVAQMLTCMDSLDPRTMGGKIVVTIAATNRPDSLDPALRRAGRFDKELSIGIPNEKAREAILRKLLRDSRVSDDIDYKILAKATPGFVGADLGEVVAEANSFMVNHLITQQTGLSPDMRVDGNGNDQVVIAQHRWLMANVSKPLPDDLLKITMQHMLDAIKKVQPSAKREGFTTIPDTTWEQIGSLKNIREHLKLSIVDPIRDPESFAELGITTPSGVLLWGPPGCGKTLMAMAVANEANANFISIKGPELLNKYLGESERAVRQVFSRASASAPCIVFFDELDALGPRRDASGHDASRRVVNQLLTEMDGMGSRQGVYIIGATNRPDMIDSAMLRPGRLGTHIFVDVPDADGRVDILKTRVTCRLPKYPYMDVLDRVARDPRCARFSGADLENLHRAAGEAAVKRAKIGPNKTGPTRTLMPEDWEYALGHTKASITESDLQLYGEIEEAMGWK
ncbi:P-loop containing nucleoside triphosphate hydrolase protein [Biscogniauxia marginata]|nr:P-loop containing nucleoside triphosphate hydrolase protein [Biscogniauxia marginata]